MCYYKCFDRVIALEIADVSEEKLNFWINRFCPSVEKINHTTNTDIVITYEYSKSNDYTIQNNNIILSGDKNNCESSLAKFITQVFQKLLINDNILIIPSACIANNDNNCILIIGDFWQGKTAVAVSVTDMYNYKLVSDNYVAIKNGRVIGATKYISVREEQRQDNNHLLEINNRLFYPKDICNTKDGYKIVCIVNPHINSANHDIHYISTEESIWYLYQKYTRLLCGETILFDGKCPSPNFLNKENSKKVLKIVKNLLESVKLKYISASISDISEAVSTEFKKERYDNEQGL